MSSQINKIILLTILLLFLLVFIPTNFATSNETVMTMELSNDSDVLTAPQDYYFDASIDNDDGDGTQYNPYKELTSDRIKQNSNIYLANGEYDLDIYSLNRISFIGENTEETIINFNGNTINANNAVTFINLTVVNAKITNYNTFNAKNTIFTDSFKSTYNSKGGVIYSSSNNSKVTLDNCTFKENFAEYGGAIYMEKGILNIVDSLFINNIAYNYGGAIVCDSGAKLSINRTKFLNDKSYNNAGGGIYIISSDFQSNDVIFINCSATFGGAITSLNSILNASGIKAINNSANYSGGAIYQMYGSCSITNSSFVNNSAKEGGALFIDDAKIIINKNNFTQNSANLYAGAVYLLLCNETIKEDTNSFLNNTSLSENSLYQESSLNLFISNGNYTLMNVNDAYNGSIPKYYISPYITPVKNQGDGGNCWAFSSIATLESCILKATGKEYDLSEENMKNLMALYSDYGWDMSTNDGGYDDMGVGYLVSWLGPVLENDDLYDGSNVISPVIDSIMHVQNILFLKRDNFTDNNAIKEAILKYGAVETCIYWSSSYSNHENYYYNGDTPANHAVTIVGWDDNYSRHNFNRNPKGDGAWIIKNSWGTSSGNEGFYYVSYYDTRIAQVGKSESSYTFILNDTIRYDKNYQYDIAGKTDYYLNGTNKIWYKNIFNASDDEYLAAVSTYFEKTVNWTYSIYVNNILKLTKSGLSNPGYYTFNLDNLLELKRGDVFEVVFNVSSKNYDVTFPISEIISLNKLIYSQNVSYFSFDGRNWIDLFNHTGIYSTHIYTSQVACIKAFTILDKINTTTKFIITNNGLDKINITAHVFDSYGNKINGNLTINVLDKSYNIKVINGIAQCFDINVEGDVNITSRFSAVGYNSPDDIVFISIPYINTTLELSILENTNPVNITAIVRDLNGKLVNSGEVTFDIGVEKYVVKVNNGKALLTHVFKNTGINTINAVYNDISCYNSSSDSIDINITLKNTNIELMISTNNGHNPVEIKANVSSDFGIVNSGNVVFKIGGKNYVVNVLNGIANITHIFEKIGVNTIQAVYYDSYYYESSKTQENISISLINTKITLEFSSKNNPVSITAHVLDEYDNIVKSGHVVFNIEGIDYDVNLNDNTFNITHIFKNTGASNVYVKYYDSYYYKSSNTSDIINISKIKTNLTFNIETYQNNATIKLISQIPINERITVSINNTNYTTKFRNGIATFILSDFKVGSYLIKANINSYTYYANELTDIFIIKEYRTLIIANNYSTYWGNNDRYYVTLKDGEGKIINNSEIIFTINSKTYKNKTNEFGVASIPINLTCGTYTVNVSFMGNKEYLKSHTSSKITIKSTIVLPNPSNVYLLNTKYTATILDNNGIPLKNKQVTAILNNIYYKVLSDKKGIISINIRLNPGTYKITIINPQTGENISQNFKVISRITLNKDINIYFGQNKLCKIRIYDDNGKPAAGVKVTFKINSKTYTKSTDKNGYAILAVNNLKIGKYTVKAIYKGFKVSNKISIKSTLITKNITKKKSKTIKFQAKLVNTKGKVLKGKKINFKIKGKKYESKTNKKGIATITVKNLQIGKYKITTSYGKLKISNKITIKR